MLADLGADVIKIEPPAGDLTRFASPRRNGLSSYFVQQNVGKRNISLDLSSDAGAEILLDLAEHADVLVQNYRPGVMDRLGLGVDALLARNPRLIYASISGYGQTGPWVRRRAYAPVVEAEAGIIASQGASHGGPLSKDPHSHADVYTAIETASAILAALYQRERTGLGQAIDVSMAETMLYVNEHLHDSLWDGDDDPNWIRSFRPGDYLVLDRRQRRVARGQRAPGRAGHVRLLPRRDESARPPRRPTLRRRRQPAGQLRRSVRRHPRVRRRGGRRRHVRGDLLAPSAGGRSGQAARRTHDHRMGRRARCGGRHRRPRRRFHPRAERPVAFQRARPTSPCRGVPKYRGEDNRALLTDLLGYDDEHLDDLEASGVLSSRCRRTDAQRWRSDDPT